MQFIKVKELNDKFANETVDIVGIVDKVDPSAVIQTREGKEVRAYFSLKSIHTEGTHALWGVQTLSQLCTILQLTSLHCIACMSVDMCEKC